MPINTLKIDKSFIQHIPDLQDDCELTRAIIAMGHSLGMRIVAEGVQRTEQIDFLRSLSCDVIQGFLCSPAIPASLATEEFLANPSTQWAM